MLLQQCWQLWPEALCFSGCLSVRPILVNSISQEHLEWISPQIWLKKTHHHDSKMHRLEFRSQRSEVKVTVTSQNTCWRQHMKKYLIGLKWWGCNIWYPEGWSQIQTTRIELIWFTRFARSKLARQIYRRTRCHHSTQHVGRTNASGAVQIRSGPDAFWVKCSAEKKKKFSPLVTAKPQEQQLDWCMEANSKLQKDTRITRMAVERIPPPRPPSPSLSVIDVSHLNMTDH